VNAAVLASLQPEATVITPRHSPPDGNGAKPLGSLASLGVIGLVSCLMAIDALTHSKPMVLPAISVVLTVVGFAWAAGVVLRHANTDTPLRDKMTGPGLFVFFGCAAAMLSDADQVARYLHLQ
jgi:hypothetical protein